MKQKLERFQKRKADGKTQPEGNLMNQEEQKNPPTKVPTTNPQQAATDIPFSDYQPEPQQVQPTRDLVPYQLWDYDSKASHYCSQSLDANLNLNPWDDRVPFLPEDFGVRVDLAQYGKKYTIWESSTTSKAVNISAEFWEQLDVVQIKSNQNTKPAISIPPKKGPCQGADKIRRPRKIIDCYYRKLVKNLQISKEDKLFIVLRKLNKEGDFNSICRAGLKFGGSNHEVYTSSFLRLRAIMLDLFKHFQHLEPSRIDELEFLWEYFSGIGDQSTTDKIERAILKKLSLNPQSHPVYIKTILCMFLSKKLFLLSPDNFLHNHYIAQLQGLHPTEPLMSMKQNVLRIMRDIRQYCYHRRQFLTQCKLDTANYIQFLNCKIVGGNSSNKKGQDLLLVLKQIYNQSLLDFNKTRTNQFTKSVAHNQFFTPYLRMPLLKTYFFQELYLSELPQFRANAYVLMRRVPALYRYGSVLWSALLICEPEQKCQPAGLSVWRSNYMPLVRASEQAGPCHCVDLLLLLQVTLKQDKFKLNKNPDHALFRLQNLLEATICFCKTLGVTLGQDKDDEMQLNCILASTTALLISIPLSYVIVLRQNNLMQVLVDCLKNTFKNIGQNYETSIFETKEQRSVSKNRGLYFFWLFHFAKHACQLEYNSAVNYLIKALQTGIYHPALQIYYLTLKTIITAEQKAKILKHLFNPAVYSDKSTQTELISCTSLPMAEMYYLEYWKFLPNSQISNPFQAFERIGTNFINLLKTSYNEFYAENAHNQLYQMAKKILFLLRDEQEKQKRNFPLLWKYSQIISFIEKGERFIEPKKKAETTEPQGMKPQKPQPMEPEIMTAQNKPSLWSNLNTFSKYYHQIATDKIMKQVSQKLSKHYIYVAEQQSIQCKGMKKQQKQPLIRKMLKRTKLLSGTLRQQEYWLDLAINDRVIDRDKGRAKNLIMRIFEQKIDALEREY